MKTKAIMFPALQAWLLDFQVDLLPIYAITATKGDFMWQFSEYSHTLPKDSVDHSYICSYGDAKKHHINSSSNHY